MDYRFVHIGVPRQRMDAVTKATLNASRRDNWSDI
jgi:hypothetical protein